MKKVLSVLMASVVLASAAAVTASAQKYVTDDFNTFNENVWMEGAAYECIYGVCEGFGNAVVNQTIYEGDEENGGFLSMPTSPTTFATAVDFKMEEDTSETPAVGLWFTDNLDEREGLADGRNEYAFMYYAPDSTFYLMKNMINPGDAEANQSPEEGKVLLAKWTDPRELGQNMTKNTWITMGVRVERGSISCFVDGKCVITCNSADVSTAGSTPTPILFWNCGAHVMWDNFWIGDPSELKAEEETTVPDVPVIDDPVTGPAETEAPDTTEIVTKVIEVTDENGEKHTEVVTEIVTNAPKQETKQNSDSKGGSSVQTGDMAVIVVAAMVVALGTAIVVKKVNVK